MGWKTIGPFKNCYIEELHNNTYDYLYERYEMWITDAGSKTISRQNIEYMIGAEAQNIIEDGYPLRTKIINGKLVIVPNFKCTPFGFKSYGFYREYFALDELDEYFGQGKIILFEGRNQT